MRIITLNANSIRSAIGKHFFDWLKDQDADVTCIQEVKGDAERLQQPEYHPDWLHCYYQPAVTKKGYSGVAVLCRKEPDEVRTRIGWDAFDAEGRYIEARFGKLSVVSLYVPSGTSGEERQAFKFVAMKRLREYFDEWLASGRRYVLCGDWNIVRSERDIRNWKSNQKNSGCLPEERAWLNGLIADRHGDGTPAPKKGWIDSFRVVRPDADADYTWWSNRGRAYANNVGWRIDYQITTPAMAKRIRGCSITRDPKFSDHAPYTVDYAD